MSSVTAAAILGVAAKEVGTREGRDKNGNWNNRVKYNDWYANHPKIKNSGFLTTAWCAVFVSWVANQLGVVGTLPTINLNSLILIPRSCSCLFPRFPVHG